MDEVREKLRQLDCSETLDGGLAASQWEQGKDLGADTLVFRDVGYSHLDVEHHRLICKLGALGSLRTLDRSDR